MPNIESENQQLYDAGDLRKYRIELPNLYDDADLDPYEFRLLAHYKRVGTCWESTATTAAKCKMSVGKVSEARRSLQDKGFIHIQDEPSDYGTIQITVKDVWAQNFEKYTQRSHSEHDRSPHERQRSPRETKKEPIEEINNNNNANPQIDQWQSDLQGVVFGIDPQTFTDILDAWRNKPDPRLHNEALRQTTNAKQRSARVYLRAYLNFNPDYKPQEAKPYPTKREQFTRPKPQAAEWQPPTPDEIAKFRAERAAMRGAD